MQVADLIERFLAHHRRHHKPATVRFYALGLRWLERAFAGSAWHELQRDQVIAALDAGNTRADGTPYKPDTIRRNTLAIEQLQKFAIDQYDADVVLRPRDLKKPPGTKREAIPTDEELEQIFAAAKEQSPELNLAFRSLAASGMRPNELAKAKFSDLNPQRDLLVIQDHKTRGKTGKPKRVPLGETLRELVDQAAGDRSSGPIWRDETGKAWTVGKLSSQFRLLKKKVGANPVLVLYSLRHWKGTQVARKHGIHAAMTILGHKQITTTQRYTHPDDDDARRWQE